MISKKFVTGIVDADPNLSIEENRQIRYAFWEIDTTDDIHHNLVLQTYKEYGINFVSHRIGKGYHYFGEKIPVEKWKQWHNDLVRLVGNKEFPALTLRVTRKYNDEIFERPVYYGTEPIPAHFRGLMHFLNKEMKYQNDTNLKKASHHSGLDKYWKVVFYGLCPICLSSSPDSLKEHISKKHPEIPLETIVPDYKRDKT